MRALKFATVALVVIVFTAALAASWIGDSLPAGSVERQRLSVLSTFGMGLTLALGLAVGYFWLFRRQGRAERSRRR